jgi:hypothetical protein
VGSSQNHQAPWSATWLCVEVVAAKRSAPPKALVKAVRLGTRLGHSLQNVVRQPLSADLIATLGYRERLFVLSSQRPPEKEIRHSNRRTWPACLLGFTLAGPECGLNWAWT